LAPLTKLSSKAVPYKWGPVEQQAFEEIKEVISREALLAFPQFDKAFHIYTDASDYQLGLIQERIIQTRQQTTFLLCESLHRAHTQWQQLKHVTMALSNSSRLPIMVELSLRPGTSGTLNRAWPDHPCVAVTWPHEIVTTRLKALERLPFFIFLSLQFAFLDSLWHFCHGGECNA